MYFSFHYIHWRVISSAFANLSAYFTLKTSNKDTVRKKDRMFTDATRDVKPKLKIHCFFTRPVENDRAEAAQHASNLIPGLKSLISVPMSSSFF